MQAKLTYGRLFSWALAAVVMATTGCKKYEDYNTAIDIVLPAQGQHTFWLDSEFWTVDGDAGERVRVVINWDETEPQFVNGRQVSIMILNAPNQETYTNRASLKPGLVYEWDPVADELDKTGEKLDKKEFSSADKERLIGKWQLPTCGGQDHEFWLFNLDGTGIYRIPACSSVCEGPSLVKFEWSENTGAEVFIDVDTRVDCTQAPLLWLDNDTTLSYTVSETQLTINGQAYESHQ